MADEGFKRKLAAILSADVEGYSRLMDDDEEATVRTLTAYRSAITNLVEQFRGRIVDTPGDNILAEFASVVDSVNCAAEIQRELAEQNAELPENRRMQFRIGVNLGDVIHEEDRIYGNGVNIAARVETMADAGGICISGRVYDQVANKLELEYEYLGEQQVKNIRTPIRVYRLLSYPGAAAHRVVQAKVSLGKKWRKIAISAAVVVVIVAGLGIWQYYSRSPSVEPASVEKMAYPLPDKPSIAVLPFDNMSGDRSQEYIADGLSENIISSLSKIPDMLVIARNSTFAYKGKAIKVSQVAEELGVKYVLEGSVQKSGDSLRVTAQLIDAIKGHHLWSEKYDRATKDFFKVQDDIARNIVIALQVELTEGEQARIWHATENLEALGYATKGIALMQLYTKDNNLKARELFKKAADLDPNYAFAWISIAWTHGIDSRYGFSQSRGESFKRCIEFTQKAAALNDSMPEVHSTWNFIYLLQRQHDKAIAEGKRAVALGPSDATSHMLLSLTLHFAGKFEESIFHIKEAMRLDPYYPPSHLGILGSSYGMSGDYEKAIALLGKAQERAKVEGSQRVNDHTRLIQALVEFGQIERAKNEATEVLKLDPNFSLKNWQKSLFYKNPSDLERTLNALRKAGLPDEPPLPLPDKPSIAVLAFDNLSGDPEQEYIADGIAENIITTLSKLHELFVISRNSSFVYKGKPVKVQQISRELGVRYVLEGSIQRSGDRVRVTAQLIDAIGGQHLWSQRYDRNFKDIFELQDELASKIANSLRIIIVVGDQGELWQKDRPSNLQFNEKVFEARYYSLQKNKEANVKAKQLYKEAIDLEPDYFGSYGGLAYTHIMDVHLDLSRSPLESLMEAVKLCNKAIALDESQDGPHFLLGLIYAMSRKYDRAVAECERAIALNPNSSGAYEALGRTLVYAGRPEEALDLIKKGVRLNPLQRCRQTLGSAYREAGQYEEALTEFKKCIKHTPNNIIAHTQVADIYARTGRYKEARDAWSEVLKIDPNMTAEKVLPKTSPYGSAHRERTIANFHKAGIK